MTKLQQLKPFLIRTCLNQRFASSENRCDPSDQENNPKPLPHPIYIPEAPQTVDDISEPTTCCMSGCANCVWIAYAEKLSNLLKDSQADVQKAIMDKVQDPNMRAFLSMELRSRKLID